MMDQNPGAEGIAAAGMPDAAPAHAQWPAVSVVMPVRNEEAHLAEAVQHILSQDYPGEMELVLAIGPSRDRTEAIAAELAARERRLTVVANPTGQRPAALNIARRAARHQVIARVDGHAMLPPGYLRTAVVTLIEHGAADVGGIMAAEGVTSFERAVAWAMTSKAGVGAAAFHTGGGAGPADSVYLGVYQREAIERAGGYDEEMLISEDWELNYRIRAGGGLIWFTPELQVTYRPRSSVRALAKQYFNYGRWRRVVMREHPETASFRYLAPPGAAALVTVGLALGLAGLGVIAAGGPAALSWLALGFVVPATYLAGITAVTMLLSKRTPASVRAKLPLVLATMHMCWGTGFLTSPRKLHRSRDLAGEAQPVQAEAAGHRPVS